VVPPPPPPHKQIKNYNDLFIVLRKLTRFLKKSKQMWGYSPIFIIIFFINLVITRACNLCCLNFIFQITSLKYCNVYLEAGINFAISQISIN